MVSDFIITQFSSSLQVQAFYKYCFLKGLDTSTEKDPQKIELYYLIVKIKSEEDIHIFCDALNDILNIGYKVVLHVE